MTAENTAALTGTVADTRPGSGSYYQPGRRRAAETARLRAMAEPADAVSLSVLGSAVDRPGVVVADVGAGDSTSLGLALIGRNRALRYVPVDIRSEAIESHRAEGFAGHVCPATDLALPDGSVDIVHTRFLFGWLGVEGRRRAVQEFLRVTRRPARIVVVDYDWSTADGPDVVVAWKDCLIDLIATFGFDPFHGQQMAAELRANLAAAGLRGPGADHTLRETRTIQTTPLRDALPTMQAVTLPVLDHLGALGLGEVADGLRRRHASLLAHARRHPAQPVTFPAIVAAVVDLDRRAAAPAASTTRRLRPAGQADPTFGLLPAGPPGLGVHRLESDELVTQARTLQAAEYLRHGYLTGDSVGADGCLIEDIDPAAVVARSAYLGVLDAEGRVAACIRMIRPLGADRATLPTLGKASAPRAGRSGDSLAALPFSRDAVVFEVSGLARSRRCADPTATTRLLLAVVSEARRRGDDYGVMGLTETAARLLLAVYGRQAIRPLDLEGMRISGRGIRPGGVALVPCYAETDTFVTDLLQRCHEPAGTRLRELGLPLVELTAAWFEHEPR